MVGYTDWPVHQDLRDNHLNLKGFLRLIKRLFD